MRKFLSFLSLSCLAIALFSSPVFAQSKTLKENEIRDFIKKSSKIVAGKNNQFDQDEVLKFLEKHLHPDVRYKSTVKYIVPGYPEQTKVLTLEKEDVIKSIKDAPAAVNDFDYDIDIQNIRISSDGRKATLKTENAETGTIQISDNQEVPIDGISKCNQIVMLNDQDVLQMFSAQCTTIVEFLDFNN